MPQCDKQENVGDAFWMHFGCNLDAIWMFGRLSLRHADIGREKGERK
jgi:hypothetical protein